MDRTGGDALSLLLSELEDLIEQFPTPYEMFRSLENPEQYLKKGIPFKMLDEIALRESDNECAQAMQRAKADLFKTFNHKLRLPTAFTTYVSGSLVD